MAGQILFVSGIDTDVGKTIATGVFARMLAQQGVRVITQKMVQTGCEKLSDDIITHRKVQGVPLCDDDTCGLTCRFIYHYPCSPHLAAEMEGRAIDLDLITQDSRTLAQRYEVVLLEGAGGLAVPLNATQTTLDYLQQQGYPLILVTSGKLGSINHTLLSLEVCRARNIPLHTLIYNRYPKKDDIIEQSSECYLQHYLQQHHPNAQFMILEEQKAI
ncbi:ATP-dependent dethiobiotin synthetase BioD [Pasteurellaceae bacterium HPA106]|uniref:dethiobiotin synthase n=1 Tax=Spirabiliibacterium pneumoniae TaxID=221400 RepID=UPI001AACBCB3|nr:dethiobiotin synthase [Spirabiliibacterium pneumoniae]MBE2895337.1 ATP-dependent dethiobiotin synthetase BioD [Spirabiliibacterium pneumoniae]